MGGKTGTQTSKVTIPPEVMARYNAVNQRAEDVAKTPFQSYSGEFVAPINAAQQAGINQTQAAAQSAQPYFGTATQNLLAAQQGAQPQLYQAGQTLGTAQNIGGQYADRASQLYGQAGQAAQPYYQRATNATATGLEAARGALGMAQPYYDQATGQLLSAAQNLQPQLAQAGLTGSQAAETGTNLAGQAQNLYQRASAASSPYYQSATQGVQSALQSAEPYQTAATQSVAGAGEAASPLTSQAELGLGAALAAGQPYQAAATEAVTGAGEASSPFIGQAAQGLGAALAANAPYQELATALGLAGSQAVTPQALDVNAYMSPYTKSVADTTLQALRQQQQQEMSGQLGSLARSGGFGGDRAGIIAANLAKQQQLGTAQALAPIYQQGYAQALAAAQQQQGVGLSAEQANRTALQQTAQQMAALGQQGFGQKLSTAQQQAALGQQLFGQNITQGQQLAALGQQGFGQQLSTAQQQAALGQQLFGQGMSQAQQLAALGQQGFGQQLSAAQQMANLGQSLFGQNLSSGQALAGLGQQQFGQGLSLANLQSALAQQGFGAGTQTAQQLAALGSGAQQAQLAGAQGVLGAGQQMAGLGQALYGQNLSTGQALAGLGAQQFGQGATTAQQLAALAQQGYGMGASTAQQLAALGTGAQAAGLQGAQATIGAGTLQQQTQQAADTAQYQQFLQERGYPFQVAQFLANIAEGTGALSGSTTTSTGPISFFSDRRLKDDIKEIGKTHDGQPIYSYKYKGDDATQIGLMAQDVEKKHPEAVGLAGGYKTVDYKKATEDSERKAMGGSVYEPGAYDRGGYADGGLAVDPYDLQQILAQQKQFLGPYGEGGLYGGSQHQNPMGGLAKQVPTASMHTPKLLTPSQHSVQTQDVGGLGTALSMLDRADTLKEKFTGQGIYKGIGEKLGLGKSETTPPPDANLPGKDDTVPLPPIPDRDKEPFAQGGSILPYQSGDGYVPEAVLDDSEDKKLKTPDATKMSDPGANDVMTAMAMANMGSKLFSLSDRRMKENVEPIGKTYDGQNIYRYDFGDGKKQIGLIAQEVLHKHPNAVGEHHGMLMVDYAKATDKAAKHYYEGGIVPRHGYALDGEVKDISPPPTYGTPEYDPADDPFYGGGVKPKQEVAAAPPAPAPKLPAPIVIRGKGPSEGVKPADVAVPDREDSLSRLHERVRKIESGGRQFDETGKPLTSSAGAVGIMQILPSTGPEAAKLAGLPWDETKFFNDPEYNDKLGRAYLGSMYEKFGSPQLAAAAYNAGPGRVSQALKKSSTEGGDVMSYLPAETKNYVAKLFGSDRGVKPTQLAGADTGAAPAAPSSSKGLFGLEPPYTPEGKNQDWNQFLTSQNFIVPFLSGLKGMAQSKSPFLGAAMLEGLGSGAETYAGLQKQQADIGRTRAETQAREAQTARSNIYEVGGRLFVLAKDPKSGQWKPMRGYEYFQLPENERPPVDASTLSRLQKEAQEDAKGAAPTGAPAAPVGGAPTTPTTPSVGEPKTPEGAEGKIDVSRAPIPSANILTEAEKSRLDTNAKRIYFEPEGGKNEPDYFTPQTMVAKAMGDLQNQMAVLSTSLSSLPRDSSLLTAGPLSETLGGIVSTLNQAANVLGYKGSFIGSAEDLGSAEAVNKAIANLKSIATTESGQRAVAALGEMAARFPSLINSTSGRGKLLADIMVQQRREIDRNNYGRAILERESQVHPDIASKQGRELYAMFDDRYGEPFYGRDREALDRMYNDKMQIGGKDVIGENGRPMSTLEYLYKNGHNLSEKQKDWFRSNYKNPDILRYFGI